MVGNFLSQTNLPSHAEDFSFDDPVVSLGHAGFYFHLFFFTFFFTLIHQDIQQYILVLDQDMAERLLDLPGCWTPPGSGPGRGEATPGPACSKGGGDGSGAVGDTAAMARIMSSPSLSDIYP